MNTVRVAPLVEEDGEVNAVPVLLRRIIATIKPGLLIEIAPCFRQPSASIKHVNGIERAVETVARRHPKYPILVLIDSDDDCPKELGATLLARARNARPDLHISVVLAYREYETWFLSAAESLAGKRNLRSDLAAPVNPESIRDAKGWLTKNSVGTAIYRPTQDQAALSHALDLQLARAQSRSFKKLWAETERIVAKCLSVDS